MIMRSGNKSVKFAKPTPSFSIINFPFSIICPAGVILSEVEGSLRLHITDAQKILRLASLAQNDTTENILIDLPKLSLRALKGRGTSLVR